MYKKPNKDRVPDFKKRQTPGFNDHPSSAEQIAAAFMKEPVKPFRIYDQKKLFLVGMSAVLVVALLLIIAYLNYDSHYKGSRLISVDVYADNTPEGLAFYEALPDDKCVNVLNEQTTKIQPKAAQKSDQPASILDAPLIRASAPKCTSASALPADYQKLGKAGYVGLVLNITETGTIARGEIDKSSGVSALDEAALKQVTETWSFEPCKKADMAVACRQTIKFRWKAD